MTQQEFQNQTAQGWLTLAGSALKKAAGAPIRLFLKLSGILLLLAAAKSICGENERQFEWLAALCVFALCSQDFTALIAQMETALSECKAYLASFVPVFASVLVSCGQAGSAAVYSGLFFTAALFVCDVLCNVGLPAVRIFLAFHATGCVGGGVDLSGLASSLCRASKWALGLCATLFGALISLQGVFAQSADTTGPENGKICIGLQYTCGGQGCFGRHGQHPCRAENAEGRRWVCGSSGGGGRIPSHDAATVWHISSFLRRCKV